MRMLMTSVEEGADDLPDSVGVGRMEELGGGVVAGREDGLQRKGGRVVGDEGPPHRLGAGVEDLRLPSSCRRPFFRGRVRIANAPYSRGADPAPSRRMRA